jgi:lycopene cyclase domain-containing protein
VADYTASAIAAAGAVVGLEISWLRTGLFGRRAYYLTLVIVLCFQVGVDGWLTKLDAPIVIYGRGHSSGIRFPWDIPAEDFLFGFALVTLVLLLWERAGGARRGCSCGPLRAGRPTRAPTGQGSSRR